ncbi:MAG TPA: ubiquinone/menaquinone biosynthesis methyltransferase [Granulicella sp.]
MTHPEHELHPGARPTGAADEAQAAHAVQQMFNTIAPKYDLLNHLLSGGVDRWWWARASRSFREVLRQPESAVLDLCCGTGDMTLALYKHRPNTPQDVPMLAADFSREMLARGMVKFAGKKIQPLEADALHMPLESGSLDLVVSAFGFRNLANYEEGLAEIFRVLRPGGQIGILDFNQPDGLLGAFYAFYFRHVLTRLGGLISGDRGAYTYLPESVGRFPKPKRMVEMMQNAGFQQAGWTSYTFGIAGLYRATKP